MLTYAGARALVVSSSVPPAAWLAIALLVFAVLFAVALWLGLQPAPERHAARPHRDRFRREPEPPKRKRMAVIVNPTKFDDLTAVRDRLAAAAAALDWDPPLILETTIEDPGYGQARAALAESVDVVAPLGGDGTVRMVASALVGTSTPLGLLPAGTGNLLARNLELPVTDLAEAVRLACTGRNRPIDVGFVALQEEPLGTGGHIPASGEDQTAPHDPAGADGGTAAGGAAGGAAAARPTAGAAAARPTAGGPVARPTAGGGAAGGAADDGEAAGRHTGEQPFLVMAGIGLDATIMSDTTEAAKAKLGWSAYVATGLRNFLGPRLKAHVSVDGGPAQAVHASTILIGNVGRITGGINLMPEAEVDDGILDCVVLAPKGLPGWVNVTARVMTKNRGERTEQIHRYSGRSFEVTTEVEQPVQLDGDVVGATRRLTVRVAPGALLVRT